MIVVPSEKDGLEILNDSSLPCFFASGASNRILEPFALELANAIEKRPGMRLKGSVKHFSIRMPYCTELEAMNCFLGRLLESVCIAKDCYEAFRGLVLIELDPDWCENGPNRCFDSLTEFIQNHSGICFVLIAEGEGVKQDALYSAVESSAVWLRVEPARTDIEYCCYLFRCRALEKGYKVTDEALSKLRRNLTEKEKEGCDVKKTVFRTLEQIDMLKKLMNDVGGTIDASDLAQGVRPEGEPRRAAIGFCRDI